MFHTVGGRPALRKSLLPAEVLRLPQELARVELYLMSQEPGADWRPRPETQALILGREDDRGSDHYPSVVSPDRCGITTDGQVAPVTLGYPESGHQDPEGDGA